MEGRHCSWQRKKDTQAVAILLLNAGADIKHAANDGATPLSIAAQRGNEVE